jgi:dihydroxyacetone kinase-like protein
MDQNRQIDVGTLLDGIASTLAQNQQYRNQVDTGPGGGTHGERMAQAFQVAAQAAENAGTSDAGEQLAVAAQAMRQQGRGKAANYYANGLEEAASQFRGQSGISIDSLLPLLQSFLGGVQQNNPAQPGQGTMIDALLPAVLAYANARQQGADNQQAAIDALNSAISGARGTASHQRGGNVDPGAASAANVLGGIVGAFLPGVIGALSQGRPQVPQGAQAPQGAQDPLAGLGGLAGDIGSLLGGTGAGAQAQGGSSSGSWTYGTPSASTGQDQDRSV